MARTIWGLRAQDMLLLENQHIALQSAFLGICTSTSADSATPGSYATVDIFIEKKYYIVLATKRRRAGPLINGP